MTDKPSLHVSVHGPGATIQDAVDAGNATRELLDAIAEEIGAPVGMFEVQSVCFQCDGCGFRRPDRPSPDEGWTYREGDDFCPTCSEARS